MYTESCKTAPQREYGGCGKTYLIDNDLAEALKDTHIIVRGDFDDSDIVKAYPKYSPDDITDAERNWITTGIWDKEGFVAEITA